VRHPVEIFDNELLALMTESLSAAVITVRLSGLELPDAAKFSMARRIIAEAGGGSASRLSLTEAALAGEWS
jgi:hypothetical protein